MGGTGASAKHIGIVGSTADGTALCYRALCHDGASLPDGAECPIITMHTLPLSRYLRAIETQDWTAVGQLLTESSQALANAGADFIICPNNTLHEAFRRVMSPIPWVLIADVVAEEARRRHVRRLGLIGTRTVTEGTMYHAALNSRSIEIAVPPTEAASRLHTAITTELIRGTWSRSSARALQDVISALTREGCDAAVLACTELPTVIDGDRAGLPLLDSTRLLARAALRMAINGRAGYEPSLIDARVTGQVVCEEMDAGTDEGRHYEIPGRAPGQ